MEKNNQKNDVNNEKINNDIKNSEIDNKKIASKNTKNQNSKGQNFVKQKSESRNTEEQNTEKSNSAKHRRTINGISIWRILAYFIIYSVLGYIIETLYGIITKGVWESRQSFLYGPFCGIYGLGAVVMIICLHKFPKKFNALFIGGFIVGSIVEYAVSFFGEMFLGVKWWDYSNMPLNLNGRICVYFSVFWGFLGIYLIASVNPKVDRIINWIKSKFKTYKALKTFVVSAFVLLMIDCVSTGFALEFFLLRMIVNNNIDVDNEELAVEQYNEIYQNEKLSDFIYKFWGDEKMIKTFPNLKINDKNGNIVYIDSLLDIQPYYLKIHEKNNKNNEEVEEDIVGK